MRYRAKHRAACQPWWMGRMRWRRVSVYVEPRDLWIGVYIARQAVYVCPLPTLVLKWTRSMPPGRDA